MNTEYIISAKLILNETTECALLFVQFSALGECRLVLSSTLKEIEVRGCDYTSAIKLLLMELPLESQLLIQHSILYDEESKKGILKVEEYVQIKRHEIIEDIVVYYTLSCVDINNIPVSESIDEDFSIVFSKLNERLNLRLHVCANCQFSDFKSDGNEDLRHGWYCFRKFNDYRKDKVWYERLDAFDKAAPNINALYWCPKFSYEKKSY